MLPITCDPINESNCPLSLAVGNVQVTTASQLFKAVDTLMFVGQFDTIGAIVSNTVTTSITLSLFAFTSIAVNHTLFGPNSVTSKVVESMLMLAT